MSVDQEKVHFVSLGCPKNLVDSEMMLGSLLNDGYKVSEEPEDADVIVVNTCGFIEDSKSESLAKIMEMGELKASGNLSKLVVSGCLTQRYKEELVEGLPEVDVFIGSGEFQNISEILKSKEDKKDYFHSKTFLQNAETPRQNSLGFYKAYLKISEGCKKRCAFCAIPVIRGNLQSRKVEDCINETKLLVAGGVREINVISHDFTDYGWDIRRKDKESMDSPYKLLSELSLVEGLDWVRVLYLYPDGINEELLDLIANSEKLVNYFDIPLQHINNEMLKKMNRRMTREEIEKVFRMIREKIPDAVIRTQFIVGFPGETDEQFEELYDFVSTADIDRMGCFKFSPETDTKAATMENQIAEEVKQERYDRLMSLQQEISFQKNQRMIGKTLDVLVEGYSEETDLLLQGRSSLQAPDVDGVVLINDGTADVGDIVKVKITEAMEYDLIGHILE